MRQLSIGVLLTSLLACGITSAMAAPVVTTSGDTSAAIAPLTARGPGPVINPENSQYMEKSAVAKAKKQGQHHQAKHHSKKKHHGKKHHSKK